MPQLIYKSKSSTNLTVNKTCLPKACCALPVEPPAPVVIIINHRNLAIPQISYTVKFIGNQTVYKIYSSVVPSAPVVIIINHRNLTIPQISYTVKLENALSCIPN